MDAPHSFLIVAGGTGGHVLPGVALAQELQKKFSSQANIVFLTIERNRDLADFKGQSFKILFYDSPLRPHSLLQIPIFIYHLLGAMKQAFQIFHREKPHCLLGFGSYASFPALLVAILARVPIYLCEQNAIPGLVSKLMSRFAKRILVNFPIRGTALKNHKITITGNPMRATILEKAAHWQKKEIKQASSMLVLGGSQGSLQILTLVLELMRRISAKKDSQQESFQRLHWVLQCGQHLEWMETQSQELKKEYQITLFDYTSTIEKYYMQADILVCRGGAGVLSEALLFALPMIIIPLPQSADLHQQANAATLQKNGAAEVIGIVDDNPTLLIKKLSLLLAHPQRLQELSRAARKLSKSNAAKIICDILERDQHLTR